MLPSAERLAGTGLGIAAVVILALSVLALVELDREAELHREVIEGLQAKESLEALRLQVNDLAHAARLSAHADDAFAARLIKRRAVEMDAELAYLTEHPSNDNASGDFLGVRQASAALAVAARSIVDLRSARGAAAARSAAEEVERAAGEALAALEHTLESRSARLNDRTLAQIRVGETLRTYVSWLLAGSLVVLVGLFGFYRWAKFRERESQRRIEHLAHYDTVTGLPNRVLLADRLDQETIRAARNARGFALVMFDLDGFKQVNDTWGHAAGDRLLAMVAERARGGARASDTVGRLSGDEFLAILPETGLEGALGVAEKMRDALAQPFQLGMAKATLSASLGVAVFPEHGDDAEALQRAADAALYEAKRAGRNRVCAAIARPAEPVAPSAPSESLSAAR